MGISNEYNSINHTENRNEYWKEVNSRMSAILSFRLKLKKHIKKSDIQSLINQWLGESPYYDFEDTPVFPEEQESISTPKKKKVPDPDFPGEFILVDDVE